MFNIVMGCMGTHIDQAPSNCTLSMHISSVCVVTKGDGLALITLRHR